MRYHQIPLSVAMTLRLTDEQTQALRETAEREHRSMQEVAVEAVVLYTSRRTRKRDELITSILVDRADVLDRLGKA
jgi:predicted transcriptional regulator